MPDIVQGIIVLVIVGWIISTAIRTFAIFSGVNDNRKVKK